MHIASIGIDLGKATFRRVAMGERSKVLLRSKFSRCWPYTANLPASLIGLEASAGAHFPGAVLREHGHQVRLIPAQFVKPYRKSNKNDFIDAEAISQTVTKQNMRFVQIKTRELAGALQPSFSGQVLACTPTFSTGPSCKRLQRENEIPSSISNSPLGSHLHSQH